jgi:O-antigen/teichoic acid export membrane protein
MAPINEKIPEALTGRLFYQDLLSSTGFYSLAVIASKLASFVLLPLYTRWLAPSQYGILELVDLVTNLLSTLIAMRMGDALFYFHARAKHKGEQDRIASSLLIGSAVVGIIGACLAGSAAGLFSAAVFNSRQYTNYFHIGLATLAFSVPADICFSYLRALNRARLFVVASVLRLLLAIALNCTLLIVFHLGVAAILWSSLITGAVTFLALSVYCLRDTGIAFEFTIFARQIRYSAPLVISAFSLFFIHYGDRFFLQRYASLADVGIYSLAYKFGMLISYLEFGFGTYWGAQMHRVVQQPEGRKTIARVSTYITSASVSFAVLIALFIKPALAMLVGPGFQAAGRLVPYILLAYVLRSVAAQFRSVFFLHNQTSGDAKVTVVAVVTCGIGYVVLIPRWKAAGAVGATCAAFFVMAVMSYFQAWRVAQYPFEVSRLFRLFCFAGITVAVFNLLVPHSLLLQITAACAFAGLFGLSVWFGGFLLKEERAAIGDLSRGLSSTLLARAGWGTSQHPK